MPAISRAGPRRATDSGMVTVEAAIALCAFVTMVAMALGGVATVLDQIRCTDAAREAARLVARGAPDRASDAVGRIAPGATLTVSTAGDAITVAVREPAAGGLLPGLHVDAEAYAVHEPTADDPPGGGPASVDQGPQATAGRPAGGGGR